MEGLIAAVKKQNQIDEGSTAENLETNDKQNNEQQKRKRKLSFDTTGNRAEKSATVGKETEQAAAKKQKATKVNRKATGEKENSPANAAKDKIPKKKSNRKEKEVAKARAAKEAAMQFFKSNSGASILTTHSIQSEAMLSPNQPPHRSPPLQPVPTTPVPIVVAPPSTFFSTATPAFPLASGNVQYPSATAYSRAQPNQNSSSMLHLLNSPLHDSAELDIIDLPSSPHCLETTSPSSVASLFKESIHVLQESESETNKNYPETVTGHGCENCKVLSEKIRELEEKLEILKPPREVSLYFEKMLNLEAGNPTPLQKSSEFQSSKDYSRSDHFTPASGKQELYAGCGVYISCVELHTILAKSIGKPQELLGQLVTYYFDNATLAKSVPLQESRAKDKDVLDQRIIHAILVYSKKCHSLWVKEKKVSGEARYDWGRIIRNKCITATRRLERRLKKECA